jgi:hypothetical protein
VLVTLTGADGKTVTKTIDVKQLARDPRFEAITSNPYPPTAGEYTFTVMSDWAWRAGSSTEPSWLVLDDFETRPGSPTASHEYTFRLEEYPGSGYSTLTREAYINVASDDPEFPSSTTVLIVQTRGPYLVITDPASKQHAFGTTARIVTFRVNAGWTFATDANFDKVIEGATYNGFTIAAGDVKTGAMSPDTEVIEKVTFAPVISSLAGFATTNVTFSTTNHSGVPTPASDAVTFTRLVPADWTFISSDPVAGSPIPTAASTEVTIVANTNLPWWGQLESGAKIPSGPLAAYKENDEVKVTVPARQTNVASSWNSLGESITIRAGYDAQLGLPALASPHEFTLNQPVYQPINVSDLDPPTIVGRGGNVNVTFTNTDAPDFYVEWRDLPTYEGSTALSSQIKVEGIGVKAVVCPETTVERNLYLYHATTGELLYSSPVVQSSPLYLIVDCDWVNTRWSCPGGYSKWTPVVGTDVSDRNRTNVGIVNSERMSTGFSSGPDQYVYGDWITWSISNDKIAQADYGYYYGTGTLIYYGKGFCKKD